MLRDITFSRRKAASSINKATSRHVGVALNEAGANSRGRCLSNLVAPLSTSRNARSGIERKTRIYPTYPATEAKLASSYSKLIQVCGLGSQLTSTVNATAVTRSAMTCPYSFSLRKYTSSSFGPTPISGFTSGEWLTALRASRSASGQRMSSSSALSPAPGKEQLPEPGFRASLQIPPPGPGTEGPGELLSGVRTRECRVALRVVRSKGARLRKSLLARRSSEWLGDLVSSVFWLWLASAHWNQKETAAESTLQD